MRRAEGTHPPGVSATSRAGHPVRWTRTEIVLELVAPERGSPAAADLVRALDDGVHEWNAALDECAAPKLRIARGSVGRIRQDGRSVVLVRTSSWCPDGATEREDCYDPTRAAKTHLYPVQSKSSPRDGEVEEADIEINAVDHRWSLDGNEPGTRSLRAIVAHELGHVLGLDHSQETASIMFSEPVEPGRKPVLSPGDGEAATLCALYSETRR